MLNPSQKQRLERQKLERQVRENKEEKKESKKSYWKNPQEKANFNKTMRHKLEDGLRGLSDMVLLLESLPPNVLENAKLEVRAKSNQVVEVFLEKLISTVANTNLVNKGLSGTMQLIGKPPLM